MKCQGDGGGHRGKVSTNETLVMYRKYNEDRVEGAIEKATELIQ